MREEWQKRNDDAESESKKQLKTDLGKEAKTWRKTQTTEELRSAELRGGKKKTKRLPQTLETGGVVYAERADWPIAMARRCETTCNRTGDNEAKHQERMTRWRGVWEEEET